MARDDSLLIVCPDKQKEYLLKEFSEKKQLINVKFMNIESFKKNYFYDFDDSTISFIMKKYQFNLDISKMYIKNMYFIDVSRNYSNKKLKFLKEIKIDLIENKMLKFNHSFKKYLIGKKIRVINYPNLEKYLVDVFNELGAEICEKDYLEKNFTVYEAIDIYEEVIFLINKIIELYKSKVNINQIFIVNLKDDYRYVIDRLFKMFKLPIELENNSSIDSTLIVKRYLIDGVIPDSNNRNSDIVNKLIDIENSLVYLKDDPNYRLFLKQKIKDTKLSSLRYKNAIRVNNLFDRDYDRDDYVFVLGFNEGILPVIYKDEEYITDSDKDEVSLYSTRFLNKREKENVIKYLSNIPNLFISYKLSSFKDVFYPSSMIGDYNMSVIPCQNECFNYSNKYNLRMLSIYLDNYYKYKEENKNLRSLYKTYKDVVLYNTYSNVFTGISKKNFIEYMGKIGLAYTSMNTYNLCGFKYYVNYVLKLDPFCENFQTFIGNLFHYMLEVFFNEDFEFDIYWNNYIKDKKLEIKERFFLEKLKKNLKSVLDIIEEQRMYTDFKECYCEKNIVIPLENGEIDSYFSGKIDKIMYYKNSNDTYFSIVDYKTGSFDNSLNNMKYGIGMQLAIYLYLVEKSGLFTNPILAGMYFQKVLIGNVNYDLKKSYQDKMRDSLKLVGYSTDNEDILRCFDHEYTDSKIIKSMKVTSKGFSRYAKLIDRELELSIFNYTEKIIYETLQKIVEADFGINPKKIDFKDVSCKNCKYRDLCYIQEDDYVNLEQVTDFSFLVGDKNG